MEIAEEIVQLTDAYRAIASEKTRSVLLRVTRSLGGDRPPTPTTLRPPGPEASAEEIDVHVGARIRIRREALGISQGRLGRLLGVTSSQIEKYEDGKKRIGAGRLVLIAHALGTNAGFFLDGNQVLDPSPSPDAITGEKRLLIDAFDAIAQPDDRLALIAVAREIGSAARS